jgi:DNA-binding response OmpR family regulator
MPSEGDTHKVPEVFLHHSPGRAVCVVESDDAARKQIVETLTVYGCHVHEAATAAAALEITGRISMSLMLVNVVLPDMSGLGLIKRLRDLSPSLRIIAISDGGNAHIPLFLELAHYAGADATLTAPVSPLELCTAVRAGLRECAPSICHDREQSGANLSRTDTKRLRPLPYEYVSQVSVKLDQ